VKHIHELSVISRLQFCKGKAERSRNKEEMKDSDEVSYSQEHAKVRRKNTTYRSENFKTAVKKSECCNEKSLSIIKDFVQSTRQYSHHQCHGFYFLFLVFSVSCNDSNSCFHVLCFQDALQFLTASPFSLYLFISFLCLLSPFCSYSNLENQP
jgi:hypothetical protein